jgi:alpha-glucosidase
MDINIHNTQEEGQYLEYVTIGGVFDFYFMAGPTPTDVSKQYAEIIGLPAMYPYWVFGFHQCKYGYWDVNYLAEVAANYSTAGIPLDVLWSDIDSMNFRKDFTLDPERFPMNKMRLLIDTLHRRGQRFVTMLDPGIARTQASENYGPYQRGHDIGVFLKAADGSDHRGVQWPGPVVWPDWFNPKTQDWWTNEITTWFNPETGMDVDGLWNDMNEASNFCPNPSCNPEKQAIEGNNPPKPGNPPRPNTGRPIPGFPPEFQPGSSLKARQLQSGQMKGLPDRNLFTPKYKISNHRGELSDFTIFTNISNFDGTVQYDTHNFYGSMMARATRNALAVRNPKKRPFVLSRSTFAGTGNHAAHWFGDNYSSWDDYRFSISQMLAFAAMHQMPMVGNDICGFNGNAQEKMCARWALLGAFQPFYRNHADISAPNQEFYLWSLTTEAAKKAISIRYRLLDYIYTALHQQSTTGKPLVNPMFFLYPQDSRTFGIQSQWFYGDAILVSPVVDDDSTSVTYYLPDDQFYDFWTFAPIRSTGRTVTQHEVGFTDIPLHIRGGTIIPLRSNGTAMTTNELRRENFVIIVAPGVDGTARGALYLDDGESVQPGDNVSNIELTWNGSSFSAKGSFGFRGGEGDKQREGIVVVESVIILGQTKAVSGTSFDAATSAITVKGPWNLQEQFEFRLST